MIIDTEKDGFQITISIGEAFNLLAGNGLTHEAWIHLAGMMGEWYHDTWLERYVPESESKQEDNNKDIIKEGSH